MASEERWTTKRRLVTRGLAVSVRFGSEADRVDVPARGEAPRREAHRARHVRFDAAALGQDARGSPALAQAVDARAEARVLAGRRGEGPGANPRRQSPAARKRRRRALHGRRVPPDAHLPDALSARLREHRLHRSVRRPNATRRPASAPPASARDSARPAARRRGARRRSGRTPRSGRATRRSRPGGLGRRPRPSRRRSTSRASSAERPTCQPDLVQSNTKAVLECLLRRAVERIPERLLDAVEVRRAGVRPQDPGRSADRCPACGYG